MKKIALIAAVATGLVGVANAAVIFEATTNNTTLVNNNANGSIAGMTLTGALPSLELDNSGNGNSNMGGFTSTDSINTLLGASLADTNTVAVSAVVSGIVGDLGGNAVEFGISLNATDFRPAGSVIAVASGNGGDYKMAAGAFAAIDSGLNLKENSLKDGFSFSLVANVDGYVFTISDVEFTTGSATSATIEGPFTGSEFLDIFSEGHFYFAAQQANGSTVSTSVSSASIDVYVQETGLKLSPTALSFELFAPDTSTNGTITASYVAGGASSADVEIVSLVADAGFSASPSSFTLGLSNTNEAIMVTFTNSVGLIDLGDSTNSTLVITWTEVGSGVTNTSEAALVATYTPVSPEPPMVEHGTIVFEAATTNTTLVSNDYGGGSTVANVHLTGASPDLALTNDGPSLFMGGFASSDPLDTLNGAALTDEDTVVMTMTVDSLDGNIRANGVEFGLAADALFRGGSSSNLIVSLEAGDKGSDVKIWYSFQDDGDSGYKVTDASLYDGFGLSLAANSEGYTFLITDVDTGTGTNWISFSGTFSGTEFLDNFGGGHFYYAAQKFDSASLISTISDATLSVVTPLAEKPVVSESYVSNGNFNVVFTGTVGQEYGVESKDDLVFGDWETVTNFTALPVSPMTVSWPTTNSVIFYRVITP